MRGRMWNQRYGNGLYTLDRRVIADLKLVFRPKRS